MVTENIVLSSPEPIDNGKYSYYPKVLIKRTAIAAAVIFFFIGLFGEEGGFFSALLGLLFGPLLITPIVWIFYLGGCNRICQFKLIKMEKWTFSVNKKIDSDSLIQELQKCSTSSEIVCKINDEGRPVVKYKDKSYEIVFKEDKNAFTVEYVGTWHDVVDGLGNVAELVGLLDGGGFENYIGKYRERAEAYGFVAYHVQQCCK